MYMPYTITRDSENSEHHVSHSPGKVVARSLLWLSTVVDNRDSACRVQHNYELFLARRSIRSFCLGVCNSLVDVVDRLLIILYFLFYARDSM